MSNSKPRNTGKLDITDRRTIKVITEKSLQVAAGILGVHMMTVKRYRTKLGIGALPTRLKIPTAVLKRLGTLPDAVLARETGFSDEVLRRRRIELGIDAFSLVETLTEKRSLAIIKSKSIRRAALELGVSRTTIEKIRSRLTT